MTPESIDDFLIDRICQPVVDLAGWHFGVKNFTIAKVMTILGAIGNYYDVVILRGDLTGPKDNIMLAFIIIAYTAIFLNVCNFEKHSGNRGAPPCRLILKEFRIFMPIFMSMFVFGEALMGMSIRWQDFVTYSVLPILPYFISATRNGGQRKRKTSMFFVKIA
jgi:hypothetical protein